jgi:DNA sulfur modification protein DndB
LAEINGAAERDYFVADKNRQREITKKLLPYTLHTVPLSQVAEREAEKWMIHRRLKRSVVMRQAKPSDVLFCDRVWAAVAKLGFKISGQRPIQIGPLAADVFAADDETALVIICRSASQWCHDTLKAELECLASGRQQAIREIRTLLPGRKIKFIIATSNIATSEATDLRVEEAGIAHFDEDAVDYYLELGDHLGAAARYQLLGNLFAGTKIPELDNLVPAIQGKLGGYLYYSFLIEPARLLKIAYILHRNKANNDLAPTYQRLIKKNRLQKIARFVDSGGFFPNSIILALEPSGARGPHFDRAAQPSTSSQIGILHLPQTYRAAYVIDGQHRLYGYAGSHRSETDLIPVVAFVGLPRPAQASLFMQINENQQAVPKNLRNTLNADLLYDSSDARERARALRLRIAQQLEEKRSSPLRGRIIIGEEKATSLRCINIESIGIGLERGNFIGSVTKTGVKDPGTFWMGSNSATERLILDFLQPSFAALRDGLPEEWAKGRADDGVVFTNNGVEAFLRVLSDVVDYATTASNVNIRSDGVTPVFAACVPLISVLIAFWRGLTPLEAADIRRQYGGAGRARYWRKLQAAVHDAISGFDPPGLEEFLADEKKAFNNESYKMISDIELFLKRDIKARLAELLGPRWFKDGVPERVYEDATMLAAKKNRERDDADEVQPWDCLMLSDYGAILQHSHANWQAVFKDRYTRPGDETKAGSWKGRVSWLRRLVEIRNEAAHNYSVKEEEYNFVSQIHGWLELGSTGRESSS